MAAGNTNSTGSVSLRVRGSSTQPAGTEGLIWVKTENPIAAWIVAVSPPDSPESGTVWIYDGAYHPMNILKRNTVEIRPSACQQYVSGVWENVDAYVYTGGTFTQFSSTQLILFDRGDPCTDLTGGWTGTLMTDSMKVSGQHMNSRMQNVIHNPGYTTLLIEINVTAAYGGNPGLRVYLKGAEGETLASADSGKGFKGAKTMSFSITALSDFYVEFASWGGGAETSYCTYIYKVYLTD